MEGGMDWAREELTHEAVGSWQLKNHPEHLAQVHKNVRRRREVLPRWTLKTTVLDDGHTWRKYGQKEILGSKYPRNYYRCQHRNTKGCLARKQVQISDESPSLFEISYHGIHTCQVGPPQVESQVETAISTAVSEASVEDLKDQLYDHVYEREISPPPIQQLRVYAGEETDHGDDGYCWTKYKQKELLGAKHPRFQMEEGMVWDPEESMHEANRWWQLKNHPEHLAKGHRNVHKKREKLHQWTVTTTVLDDGHSWRKYGQKDIWGSKHPRCYYKCQHRNTKGCLAKKQVQRSDESPSLFEISYHGIHTCQVGPPQVESQVETAISTAVSEASAGDSKDQLHDHVYKREISPPPISLPIQHLRVHAGEETDHGDDGYCWTKYKQKQLLGAKHPRLYYRCSYRYDQHCEASKEVQRLEEHPSVFDVTYRGRHTCIPPSKTEQEDDDQSLLMHH